MDFQEPRPALGALITWGSLNYCRLMERRTQRSQKASWPMVGRGQQIRDREAFPDVAA